MAIYLLHFDKPYKHAQHYLGFAKDMPSLHARVDEHYSATVGDGKNHRLMQVIRQAGIGFTLARIWPNGTRKEERQKKNSRHNKRLCPICKEASE